MQARLQENLIYLATVADAFPPEAESAPRPWCCFLTFSAYTSWV